MKEQRDLLASNRFQSSSVEKNSKRKVFPLFLTFFLVLINAGTLHPANSRVAPVSDIQLIVSDFLLELGISENVQVTVESRNKRLVSVERVREPEGGFLMSFDELFLAELTEVELRATIAHEIGHIWIFTHHPYLQTEELANKIALKLVSRESLEQIYERVAHSVPKTTIQQINHLPPPEDRVTP